MCFSFSFELLCHVSNRMFISISDTIHMTVIWCNAIRVLLRFRAITGINEIDHGYSCERCDWRFTYIDCTAWILLCFRAICTRLRRKWMKMVTLIFLCDLMSMIYDCISYCFVDVYLFLLVYCWCICFCLCIVLCYFLCHFLWLLNRSLAYTIGGLINVVCFCSFKKWF
jgi:hypothetical protein